MRYYLIASMSSSFIRSPKQYNLSSHIKVKGNLLAKVKGRRGFQPSDDLQSYRDIDNDKNNGKKKICIHCTLCIYLQCYTDTVQIHDNTCKIEYKNVVYNVLYKILFQRKKSPLWYKHTKFEGYLLWSIITKI